MALRTIDGSALKEMFQSGCALLLKNREEVDSLNVFPVPDGDTGTNMSQTMSAAIKELNGKNSVSVSEIADAAARGALKGARGNSGVILSQILRGFARALDGADELDAALFIKALRSGADTAYKAVMKPKEGTILTVARVIAEDMEAYYQQTQEADLVKLFANVITCGDRILKKTPDMLPVLKQAGVVDSGGRGLMVIYAGFYAALGGEPIVESTPAEDPGKTLLPGDFVDDHSTLDEIKFGYCTEFIVSHPREDMKEEEVVRLRKRLERIGDCVLVISDLSVVKVHVHTNEPGKAIQMALELGELDAIKIDNMFEEHRERMAQKAEEEKKSMKEYGLVAVALGDGFVNIFRDLMIDRIVDGGQTMNPSIDEMYQAIEATHAKNVFVLPNNTNIILAAQQAAELTEKNVIVLPTKSVPMGIAAAIAFQPERSVEENEAHMREAAEHVHTASITFAVRDTNFDGREIHEGDIMGLIDNRIALLGSDVSDVAAEVVSQMVTDETELITIYSGSDVTPEQADTLHARLAEAHEMCDVEIQKGGQPLYYYLIAVE